MNYKLAVESSKGFIAKIKEILSKKEDEGLMLALFSYDEVFKIRIPTPIPDIDIKDLPSPTPNSRGSKEFKKKEFTNLIHRATNSMAGLQSDSKGKS